MTGLAESRSKPSQSELEQLTLEAFHKLVGKEPTPIQKKAYPLILRRRDVLLVAPTGSGKTEAAILPILHIFHYNKRYRLVLEQSILRHSGHSIEISLDVLSSIQRRMA